MRRRPSGLGCVGALLTLLALVGCERETPVEKAGKDITEHTQKALGKAKAVGDHLQDAAARTAEQVKEASESK